MQHPYPGLTVGLLVVILVLEVIQLVLGFAH